MIKINEKKQKLAQYLVGGVVAVIVMFVWISIPLMQNSSLDSPAGPANLFRTRTADVSSLGNDIPPEGGAPGYSLNGGMLNNPVTSGEDIASTLFGSGREESAGPASASADVSAPDVPRPGSGSAGAAADAPSGPAPKSRLGAVPSITAGNSNSMTSGGTHSKFFGTGSAEKKEELVLPEKGFKKPAPADKRSAMLSTLQKMEGQSSLAARSFSADASRSGATSAFVKGGGAGATNLDTNLEHSASGSGLELSAAAQDLKTNDPRLGKKNINFPTPKPEPANEDEEMKKMIMQMLLSSLIGGLFSGK